MTREAIVPYTPERGAAVKPELLDNPNDPRGRTNVEIAADALMANCDSTEMVRYDAEGTCEWLWDGERVRGPHHCICLQYAKEVVAALEATGRLAPKSDSEELA